MAKSSTPQRHAVIFLPFLRLKMAHTVAGVEFLPLVDANSATPAILKSVAKPLKKILSTYIDRENKPLTNCVVATIPDRGWDLTVADFERVASAASFLFLSCWSTNKYFTPHRNVNASMFRPFGQSFMGTSPDWIALTSRIRDGLSHDGGYKHGKLKLSIPLQCADQTPVTVDEAFLKALDAALQAKSPTMEILSVAMRFVSLANTDDQLMDELAEVVLMASAFDQLLLNGKNSSSYNLGRKFGPVLNRCGSVTVKEALKTRPNIEIDPKYAAAQPGWWVHRKWMEELYDRRSQSVHKGHHQARKWAWSLLEHLVMAAHVFPLVVKALLEREGHYTLTDRDEAGGRAVDKILALAKWGAGKHSHISAWSEMVSSCWLDVASDRAFATIQAMSAASAAKQP